MAQEDDVITEIYGLMKEFSDGIAPGAFIADLIPPLSRIPTFLQWWRPRALKYQNRQTKIWMKFWNNLMYEIKQKRAPECFVKQFVSTDYKAQGISDLQGAFVAGTMIEVCSHVWPKLPLSSNCLEGRLGDNIVCTKQSCTISGSQS